MVEQYYKENPDHEAWMGIDYDCGYQSFSVIDAAISDEFPDSWNQRVANTWPDEGTWVMVKRGKWILLCNFTWD
jgi:hypothetical protein